MKIAILLTCHNRKDKTISCLSSLYEAELPSNYVFDTYLVDDGSTDGTSATVKNSFPEIKVINGDGNLFWNGGMRLAWKSAVDHDQFDFYIWLNDDTILDKNALHLLFKDYHEACLISRKEVVITAACRDNYDTKVFSYGGRNDSGPLIPNGNLQMCKFINGNLVLVPKKIFEEIGFLSKSYTHAMGDFDYGLRAQLNGFDCYTTKQFIATCPTNKGIPAWCNPKNSLRERWKLFHSPRGLNMKEYITFRKRFWGYKWIKFALKAYFRVLFPSIYLKLNR